MQSALTSPSSYPPPASSRLLASDNVPSRPALRILKAAHSHVDPLRSCTDSPALHPLQLCSRDLASQAFVPTCSLLVPLGPSSVPVSARDPVHPTRHLMSSKHTGPRKAPLRGEKGESHKLVTESHRGTQAPCHSGQPSIHLCAHRASPPARGGRATLEPLPGRQSRARGRWVSRAPRSRTARTEPGGSRSRLGAACDFLSGSSSRLGRRCPPFPGSAVPSSPHPPKARATLAPPPRSRGALGVARPARAEAAAAPAPLPTAAPARPRRRRLGRSDLSPASRPHRPRRPRASPATG